MKRKSLFTVFSVILVAMIAMMACEKTNAPVPPDLVTAEDDIIMDAANEDVFSQVDAVLAALDMVGWNMSKKSGVEVLETCKIVTVDRPDSLRWPKQVTIDFGDGCTIGKRTRRGIILITVTGPMRREGSQRIVTFDNFFVNDHKIEGVRTVTNEGRHLEGNYVGKIFFSVVLEDGKVITPEGNEITREVTRTRTFVEGEETRFDTRDDIWHIEGVATGVNRNGVSFMREITSPLWKEIGCRFITRGTVLISRDGKEDAILDYGDGTCDNIATITVGDEVREIKLRRW